MNLVVIGGVIVALLGVLVLATTFRRSAGSAAHVPTSQVTTVSPPGVVHHRHEYEPTKLRTVMELNETYRSDGSVVSRSVRLETDGNAGPAMQMNNDARALFNLPPTPALEAAPYIDGDVVPIIEEYRRPTALPRGTHTTRPRRP
jgi:hypothetical protein